MRSRSLLRLLAGAATVTALVLGAACSSFSPEDAAVAPALDGSADTALADLDAEAATDTERRDSSNPSRPVELASNQGDLSGVAATETTVYFAARSAGSIRAVQLDGAGGIKNVVSVGTTAPSRIVQSGGSLYWSDAANSKLGSVELVAGTQTTLVSDIKPIALAANTNQTTTTVVALGPTGNVSPVVKVRQLTNDLTLSAETPADYPTAVDVAITGDKIWWTEPGAGVVWVGSVGFASIVQGATSETGCESIAADELGVYWARPIDGLVRMLPPGVPAMAQTIAVKQQGAFSVVSDASGVYWLTTDGKLQRSGRQASELPPQTIAKGFAASFADKSVRAIALTSKYVVWITGDGKVLRQEK